MIKMEKEFIYLKNELPNFGCCGYRWCYYQIGRKWAYYRDHPEGCRHRMSKKRFLEELEKLKVEPFGKGNKGIRLKGEK